MRTPLIAAAFALGVSSALMAQDPVPPPAPQPPPPAVPAPPVAPPPAAPSDNAVRPGMSEQDVRARWGDPIAVKRMNEWTYLFYRNWNEASIGFNDVVFLQHGQVVDAVIRGDDRVYLGNSSSPGNRNPEMTPPQQRPDGASGTVNGVRVSP